MAMATHSYKARSARDAQASNFGSRSYWDYLERHAAELFAYHTARGMTATAAEMFTRSLSDSLVGNDGD